MPLQRSAASFRSPALGMLVGLAALPAGSARADQFSDYALLRENSPLCVDQGLPPAKRIASCTSIIDMATQGTQAAKTGIGTIYLGRALALQESGDDQGALRDFNTAVKSDPRNKQPWIGLGNFYAAKSDYAHALESYDHAQKIDRTDPTVYDDRGTVLESMGRHDEAIADFGRAIALDPHDTSAYSNRATAYVASQRPDLAIADLTEVIRAEPANGKAFYDRGTAYERSGALDKALDDYRNAVRLQPSFAPASAALGRLEAKDPKAALEDLSAAIQLAPRSAALRSRALLYLSMGQPERALPDLDQVIANDGSDAIAYADRGVAKAKLGDIAGAIGDYTRSLELAPAAAIYADRGDAYAHQHRDAAALADFNSALTSDPQNLPALLGRASLNYAAKRLAASLDDYTRVIEADPRNALAYFKRGNIHLDQRDFAGAFRDYSDSLELDPNQAVVLYNRAIAAQHLGLAKDAARDHRRALALDPAIDADKP